MGVTIGESDKHGRPGRFTLSDADRANHVYVIGQTGTGKTTLLRNAIVQDMERGRGVGLIDPHGDLATAILDMVPPHRTNDVVYFNPADSDYPIGLNPIAKTSTHKYHLIILNTVSALRGLWSDVWGLGRMQYILTNTLSALLYYDHSTLLGVNRMLSDERFRRKVVARVTDPVVRAFWQEEFAHYDSRLRAEAVAPIQNKVGQFATTAITRNIIGQAHSAIDFRRILDRQQLFIANLSKGAIGEDNSRLIGSFIVAQFQLAAMSRADSPEENRRQFFLYIDEFQNFTSEDALSAILSEARKYGLSLTLAHQYTAQLSPKVRAAVFGNVGTIAAFRVGFEDAAVLAQQLDPIAAHALTELDPHCAWARQLCRGTMLEPEFVRMLPALTLRRGRADTIIAESRRKYAAERQKVEHNIARWYAH